MTFFLTSYITTYYKDENDNRIPIVIQNNNDILTNLKNQIKKYNKVVYIGNMPKNFDENDLKSKCFFESLVLSGLDFKEKFVLDNRTKKQSKVILENADLIFLAGGKITFQNKFLKQIKFKKRLKNFNSVVLGVSAGSMNLCKMIANFPEELVDLKEKRWVKGLGFFDKIIIPHFDFTTFSYQFLCEEVEIVKDYIVPISYKKELIGIENSAYIMIDNNHVVSSFGNICKISNGKATKIKF